MLWKCCSQFSSVQFSRSVVSDSLRPHESQHTRPPCPSPTPRVHPNSCAMSILWHYRSLELEWKLKTDLFQSCDHCWVFQICWHIECSTFTASSFRIWNSSTGIPSPPLALFVVMLPKAHLTSYSRMSGSRWMITPSWLSELWSFFCTVLCILATSS